MSEVATETTISLEQPQPAAQNAQPVYSLSAPGEPPVGNISYSLEAPVAQPAAPEQPVVTTSVVEPEKIPEPPKAETVAPAAVVQQALAAPVVQQPAPTPEPEVDYYEKIGLPKGGEGFTKIVDAYKAGKLEEYLRVSTVDYSKMTPQQLLRIEHDKEHASLSEEQRDEIFQYELANKYNIGSDDEAAAKIGNLKMLSDANKIRSGLVQKQSEYVLPKFEQPTVTQPSQEEIQRQQEAAIKTQIAEATRLVSETPEYVSFAANRQIKVGSGDDAYSFVVPTEVDLKSAMANNAELFASLHGKDASGNATFDVAGLMEIALFAKDRKWFIDKLINHGKSLGEKKVFTQDLKNININPVTAQPTAQPTKYSVDQKPSFYN